MATSEVTTTSFNSLPREVRDQIYSQVLVSPSRIQFCSVLGLMVCDPDLLGPMAMLFSWASNLHIADEACEIFYQRNTFKVHCEDLPTFLGANIHTMLSIDVSGFVPKQMPTCVRPFETKKWVTDLEVVVEQNDTKYSSNLSYELGYLLEYPRLRNLTIEIGSTSVMSSETECTGVLKGLKLGQGLRVVYSGKKSNPSFPVPFRDT